MSKITFVCLAVAIICNLPYSKGVPQYTWNVVNSRSDATFRYFTEYQKPQPIGSKRPRTDTYVLYIMFNPSTGGVTGDDPTIRNIMELTEQKFPAVNGFKILNLFAYMNPLPEKLLQSLHVEEQRLIGARRTPAQATQEAFNFVKGQGNEPATAEWRNAANGADNIIAAWGDLPKQPLPTAAALTKNKFARYPDLVNLINAHRADWTQKWIPMIKARKNEIANWLNTNYRAERGYFLLSIGQNPRHPLKLQPGNAAHDFKNNPIPTPN